MNELGCGMRIPTVLYDESDDVLSDEDSRALFPEAICLFNDSFGPENGHLVARCIYRTCEEERGHCKIQEPNPCSIYEPGGAWTFPADYLALKV
jgi:hypothetical protein